MITVLTLLVGVLFGAINVAFFMLGYHFGIKKPNEEGVELTENNQDFIKEMANWRNFDGRR